jgi:hypothetical protein
LKGLIAVFAIGAILMTLSFLTDTRVKENTVLVDKQGVTGFYLEGGKNFDLFLVSEPYDPETAVQINDPVTVLKDVKKIPLAGKKYLQYNFQTTEDGIYKFIEDGKGKWITFAVKERKTTLPIPLVYSQILSFVGGVVIGFIIPIGYNRYQDLKDKALTNDPPS